MTNPLAQDLGGVVLLPCPFCGGQPKFGETNTGVPGMEDCGYAFVECCIVHAHSEESVEDAVEKWSTRAHSAEIAGALRDAERWERRFTEMLIGVINDTQNALGFTDEEKECSNGSLEIVAEIRELQENAARYLWLRSRLAGKEHVAELIEYRDDLSSEVDTAIDSAMQQGGGGGE